MVRFPLGSRFWCDARHGDEQKLCAFMPVLSAISSFVDATGDTIKYKWPFSLKNHACEELPN